MSACGNTIWIRRFTSADFLLYLLLTVGAIRLRPGKARIQERAYDDAADLSVATDMGGRAAAPDFRNRHRSAGARARLFCRQGTLQGESPCGASDSRAPGGSRRCCWRATDVRTQGLATRCR